MAEDIGADGLPKLTIELNPSHPDFSRLFEIVTCLKKMFIRKRLALLMLTQNSNLGSKHLISIGGDGNGKGGDKMESVNQVRSYFRNYVASLDYEPTLIDPCFSLDE